MDRDTLKCAFKCSLAVINEKEEYVYKDPITDPGKKSKKGYLTLHKTENSYETKYDGNHDFKNDILKTVFKNGELLIDDSLNEIRLRCKINN